MSENTITFKRRQKHQYLPVSFRKCITDKETQPRNFIGLEVARRENVGQEPLMFARRLPRTTPLLPAEQNLTSQKI